MELERLTELDRMRTTSFTAGRTFTAEAYQKKFHGGAKTGITHILGI